MMYRDISLKPKATSTPVVDRRRLDGHVVQLDYAGHIAQLDNGHTAQLHHDGHGHVPLDMNQELELCAPWLHQYSAASFPDDQVMMKEDTAEKNYTVEQDEKGFVDEKDRQTDKEDETLKLSNISIGSGFD